MAGPGGPRPHAGHRHGNSSVSDRECLRLNARSGTRWARPDQQASAMLVTVRSACARCAAVLIADLTSTSLCDSFVVGQADPCSSARGWLARIAPSVAGACQMVCSVIPFTLRRGSGNLGVASRMNARKNFEGVIRQRKHQFNVIWCTRARNLEPLRLPAVGS